MRWQRVAQAVIAILVIGFIGVLVTTLRQKRVNPKQEPPPPRLASDSKTETRGGGTHRVSDPSGKDRWRIDFGTHVLLPDGRSRLSDGVTAVINRESGPLNVKADQADVTQKEGSSEPKEAQFKGNVRLTGSGGLEVTTAEATYSGTTDVITVPGPVAFAKGRMTGSGLGATYDQARDVLWILDQAKVDVAPDKAGTGGLKANAKKAGLARGEHYMVLDGAARIEGEGRVTEANVVTIRMTPDDERIQLLELRGNSRITGGTGGPQSMAARDIDLTYGPDGKTLQFAKLIEGGVLQLPGSGAGAGKRIAGDTIDMGLAPDGSTVTSLNANGRVQVDLPGEGGGPAKRIKSATMTATGAPGSGLQNAQFGGGVEYRETRAAGRGTAALDRTARSLKLTVDTKPGLGALEKADFRGNVTFTDGPDFKADAQRGIYDIAADRLDLSLASGEPGLSPGVRDARISVDALRIGFALATRDMIADTNVRSTIMPQKNGSKPGAARIPSMLAQDQPANVTSNRLEYTKAGATYTGDAKLWQDKTTVMGATIVIDEKTGNLTASGAAKTDFMFEETDKKTGARRQVQSTGNAETFVYNDAKRLATYTDKAKVDGTQGTVTGDRIDLFLKPKVNELERAEAFGTNRGVVVRQGQRVAKGDHLTYTAADENYVMNGKPVEVTEEKNGTCTLTVGAEVTFNRASETARVQGNQIFPHTGKTLDACPAELKR